MIRSSLLFVGLRLIVMLCLSESLVSVIVDFLRGTVVIFSFTEINTNNIHSSNLCFVSQFTSFYLILKA